MTKQECIEYVKSRGGIETKDGWNVLKSVDLSHKNLTEIPIKFNIVQGSFYCQFNKLTSLKNSPKIVQCVNNVQCINNFKGKDYYKFLLDEKIIKKEEYLLRIL